MDIDNATRVAQVMFSVRGTSNQGPMWALRDLCQDDMVFLNAKDELPIVLRSAIHQAIREGRNKIHSKDLETARILVSKRRLKVTYES